MTGPISRFFMDDHARLAALLAQATADPGVFDAAAFQEFRAGLLRHIATEEKVLLPAAKRARSGEPLAIARQLRIEHGAIAALLVPPPGPALVDEIIKLLGPHNQLEEAPAGLYEACDQLLASEAPALLEQARAYPAVPTAPHTDGPGVCRTAEAALAMSRKQRAGRGVGSGGRA